MDATDDDGDWTLCSDFGDLAWAGESDEELALEVVVDSGADVSVAPVRFARCGASAAGPKLLMQDAQGRRIHEVGARTLSLEVVALNCEKVVLKERFSIARCQFHHPFLRPTAKNWVVSWT